MPLGPLSHQSILSPPSKPPRSEHEDLLVVLYQIRDELRRLNTQAIPHILRRIEKAVTK